MADLELPAAALAATSFFKDGSLDFRYSSPWICSKLTSFGFLAEAAAHSSGLLGPVFPILLAAFFCFFQAQQAASGQTQLPFSRLPAAPPWQQLLSQEGWPAARYSIAWPASAPSFCQLRSQTQLASSCCSPLPSFFKERVPTRSSFFKPKGQGSPYLWHKHF